MPEGDTIFRTARTLGTALTHEEITRFRTTLPELMGSGLVGLRVEGVESRGKNLLLHFSDGRALYSHMRMTGSWHVYAQGERWRRPEHQARCAVDVRDRVAVCFNAPVLELLTPGALRRHRLLSRLGPDLLSEAPDFDEALRRLRREPLRPLGDAVMDQGAVCGIGNVYKSETLFLERRDPFAHVGALSIEDLRSVLARARKLMLANLTGYPRVTHPAPGGRYWAYGRRDAPCFTCGATIRMRRQGEAGRSTYWCPTCQPPP